jgi:hypothetical protein
MSTDNDWWSWILIGTLFLLTTPVTLRRTLLSLASRQAFHSLPKLA